MIIGIDQILPKLATQEQGGPVGNDFINIHIVTGASSRLKWIDHKLVIPPTIDDFLGCANDRSGDFIIQ